DKYRAHRGVIRGRPAGARIASFSRQHPVRFGDVQVRIADHGVADFVALRFLDVGGPFAVIRDRVYAEADDLAVAFFELLLHAGQVTQFGSADGREVFRMREEHAPGIANELVEADASLSGFRLEIGRRVVDSQS